MFAVSPFMRMSTTGAGISLKAARFLADKCPFEPSLHLQLMWDADVWVKICYLSNNDPCNSTGERGDLFFLLSTYRAIILASAPMNIHCMWIKSCHDLVC